MRSARNSSLIAAAMIAALGAGVSFPAPPLRSTGGNPARRPTPPKMNTELDREIAAHNAAVEQRRADRKARRANKTKEQT